MFPFNDAFYGEASLMRQTWKKRWKSSRIILSNSQVTFLVAEIIGGWRPPSWHTELLGLYVAAICRECFYCVKNLENEYVKLQPAVIQQGFLECHHRRGWAPWKETLTEEWLWGLWVHNLPPSQDLEWSVGLQVLFQNSGPRSTCPILTCVVK